MLRIWCAVHPAYARRRAAGLRRPRVTHRGGMPASPNARRGQRCPEEAADLRRLAIEDGTIRVKSFALIFFEAARSLIPLLRCDRPPA